jgi:hypothetical protein
VKVPPSRTRPDVLNIGMASLLKPGRIIHRPHGRKGNVRRLVLPGRGGSARDGERRRQGHPQSFVISDQLVIPPGCREVRHKLFETREEAEAALADRQKEVRDGKIFGVVAKPFGQVAADYPGLQASQAQADGRQGRGDPDQEARALLRRRDPRLRDYGPAHCRLRAEPGHRVHRQLKRPIAPATINRHLGVLRCLLRLAKKWGFCRDVPHIEMGREPDGRLRYLAGVTRPRGCRRPAGCPRTRTCTPSSPSRFTPACGRGRSSAWRGSVSTSPAACHWYRRGP